METADEIIITTTAKAVDVINFVNPLPYWKQMALANLKYINAVRVYISISSMQNRWIQYVIIYIWNIVFFKSYEYIIVSFINFRYSWSLSLPSGQEKKITMQNPFCMVNMMGSGNRGLQGSLIIILEW